MNNWAFLNEEKKESLFYNSDLHTKSSFYLQIGLHGTMVHGTLLKNRGIHISGFYFNQFSTLITAFWLLN